MKKLILKIVCLSLSTTLFLGQHLMNSERSTIHEPKDSAKAMNSMKTQPLYFVENKGQLAIHVKYHLKTAATNAYFTPHEVVCQFFQQHLMPGGSSKPVMLMLLSRN